MLKTLFRWLFGSEAWVHQFKQLTVLPLCGQYAPCQAKTRPVHHKHGYH